MFSETNGVDGILMISMGSIPHPHNLASEQKHGVLTRRKIADGYPYIRSALPFSSRISQMLPFRQFLYITQFFGSIFQYQRNHLLSHFFSISICMAHHRGAMTSTCPEYHLISHKTARATTCLRHHPSTRAPPSSYDNNPSNRP